MLKFGAWARPACYGGLVGERGTLGVKGLSRDGFWGG